MLQPPWGPLASAMDVRNVAIPNGISSKNGLVTKVCRQPGLGSRLRWDDDFPRLRLVEHQFLLRSRRERRGARIYAQADAYSGTTWFADAWAQLARTQVSALIMT
jgi:hypothetical protein